jgi:YHS domain-containing protein
MRKIVGAGAALLAVAALAWAQAGKPINTNCPVKGDALKAGNPTSTYKGKVVGLCCGSCKSKFDGNPEQYVSSIPGLAPPTPRSGLSSLDDALKAAKDGTKPLVLLFGDATPKTKLFTEMLGDPSLDESFGKVAYAVVEFKKDSDEAKKFKVTSSPVLLILDPRPEAPKELKKMTGGAPPTVKSEIEKAVKALSK